MREPAYTHVLFGHSATHTGPVAQEHPLEHIPSRPRDFSHHLVDRSPDRARPSAWRGSPSLNLYRAHRHAARLEPAMCTARPLLGWIDWHYPLLKSKHFSETNGRILSGRQHHSETNWSAFKRADGRHPPKPALSWIANGDNCCVGSLCVGCRFVRCGQLGLSCVPTRPAG